MLVLLSHLVRLLDALFPYSADFPAEDLAELVSTNATQRRRAARRRHQLVCINSLVVAIRNSVSLDLPSTILDTHLMSLFITLSREGLFLSIFIDHLCHFFVIFLPILASI